MKSISTINPVITENTECSIVKVHVQISNQKVGMSLVLGVSLHIIYSYFEHLNSVRYSPDSSALTQVLHWSHA